VQVRDLASWVAELTSSREDAGEWSVYNEPTLGELVAALRQIVSGEKFDAIIVDEAQDFRREWWQLVTASLGSQGERILYIFFDSSQSILVRDQFFPTSAPLLDLTRNCRNSGSVFRLLRELRSDLPDGDSVLAKMGGLRCYQLNAEPAQDQLRNALIFLDSEGLKDIVVLTAGEVSQRDLGAMDPRISATWQSYVLEAIEKVRDASLPISKKWKIPRFSEAQVPSDGDLAAFGKFLDLTVTPPPRQYPGWPHGEIDSLWRLHHELSKYGSIKFPKLSITKSGMEELAEGTKVPIIPLAQFKGLEADGVIVIETGGSHLKRPELYVAASRARSHLVLILRDKTFRRFGIVAALGDR
jgi:hypothetical protein